MPTAEGEPAGVLADTGGVPLAVSLGSAHALDPKAVGDPACLLATAGLVGLPVAHGVAVTAAGIGADDPLVALRHAWLHIRGPVRIVLTDCETSAGPSSRSAACDATTWRGLLSGVRDVLVHDLLENPNRRDRDWGMLLLRFPRDARRVVVEVGPGERLVMWPCSGGQPVTGRDRSRVRRLARRARKRLGRPLSIEMVTTGQGDWTFVDLRFLDPVGPVGSLL